METYQNYLSIRYSDSTFKQRRNVQKDVRLSTTASISIEKVKRKAPNKDGYRFVNVQMHSMAHTYTLDQLREIHYNLGEFLKNER